VHCILPEAGGDVKKPRSDDCSKVGKEVV